MRTFRLSLLLVVTSGLTLAYSQTNRIVSKTWRADVKDFNELLRRTEIVLSANSGSTTFEFGSTGHLTLQTDRRSELDKVNNVIEELVLAYYGTYELDGKILKIQFGNLKSEILTYKIKIGKGEVRLIRKKSGKSSSK